MNERFVSHSINHEDVLLRRVFRDRPAGFYVDVGAAHPVNDSDTYMLHQRGWSGINIEPNLAFFQALQQERPSDRNLNLALSDHEGLLTWYRVGDTGLSTCDPALADRAARLGHAVTPFSVQTTTLARVLDEACPPSIDLLKVDVEGFEPQVLAGNNWDRWRPSLILVEATQPESPERRPDGVASFLEARGYRRMHFDGLNDWFAEASFLPPADAFLPPNVFDGFIPRAQAELETRVAALAEQARTTDEYVGSLKEHAAALEQQLNLSKAALAEQERTADEYAGSLKEHAAALEAQLDLGQQALRQAADAAQRERHAFEQERQAFEHQKQDLERQRQELDRELARVRSMLADATEDARRSRAEVAATQERHALLGESYEKALLAAEQARAEADGIQARHAAFAADAEAKQAVLAQKADGFWRETVSLRKELEAAIHGRTQIETSTSWRMTRPLRSLVYRLGRR